MFDMCVEIIKGIFFGWFGDVVDVVNVCLFLVSDLFVYLIGIMFDVNGGMLIY